MGWRSQNAESAKLGYLSTPLLEGIEEVVDEEEIALMKSTPGVQMPGG